MAKKKTKKPIEKELLQAGFKPNEKPKTKQEEEIERLLKMGRIFKKGG